jgi:hypothetical protein
VYCEDEGMRQFFETTIPKGARRVDAGADGASGGYVTAAENLHGDVKCPWRGRETSRRSSRICRADLNESGTEHQSRTLMSRIVQVSGNGGHSIHVMRIVFC